MNSEKSAQPEHETNDGVDSACDEVVVDQKEGFFARVGSLRLEVFFVLFILGTMSTMTPLQGLYMAKACRNSLNYSAEICDNIDNDTYLEYKENVERIVTKFSTIADVTRTIPSVIISIFAGSYASRYGVKYPIAVSGLGILFSLLGNLATIYYMEWPLWANILCHIPESLGGGLIVMLTGMFTNATLSVPTRNRRLRFFIIDLFMGVGFSVSTLIGGQMYKAYGILNVFRFGIGLTSLSLIYLLVAYKNVIPDESCENDGLGTRLKHLFSCRSFTDSYRTVTRRRPNCARRQICLCFVVMALLVLSFMSTSSLSYVFVRQMYNWSVTTYNNFQSINMGISVPLNAVIIFLFTRVIKLNDVKMVAVGITFGVGKYCLLSIAYQVWIYYIQALVGIPFMVCMVGVRSHLSKLVEQEEVGSVFAFLSSCERAVPIVGDVVNVLLFNWSLSFWPGLTYAVNAAILFGAFLIVVLGVRSPSIPYDQMTSPASTSVQKEPEAEEPHVVV